jgi:CRP/FNR family transcriptional regulator
MKMPDSSSEKVVSFSKVKIACQECSLKEICLPVGVHVSDIEKLDRIIKRKKPLARAEHLYRAGDKFHALFAVRSGSLKTYVTTEEGAEQITGFHLAGELIGLDAIADSVHPVAARALETTSVCEIPYESLDDLSCKVPGLRQQLLRIMSREIRDDEQNMLMLGQKTAEEKLAGFLISMSSRYRQRGFSPYEFNITMSRGDIGNFLGLALETVSRLFGRFQTDGLISVERKHIQILDHNKLSMLAEAGCVHNNALEK